MKKIAIACDGDAVSSHFGHCEQFQIYAIEGETIQLAETIRNEGLEHGSIPALLAAHGAEAIIAGRMGQGAYQHFMDSHMIVKTGVSGKALSAAQAYANDTLESELVFCTHRHDETHHCHHQ